MVEVSSYVLLEGPLDHPDYKNKDKKIKAVGQIAQEVGLPVQKVGTWCSSSRTQYGNLSKKQASGSTEKTLTDRKNQILSNYDFLKDSVKHREGLELHVAQSTSKKGELSQHTPHAASDYDETGISFEGPSPTPSTSGGRKRTKWDQTSMLP